jgi:hypothetical protein
MEQVLSLEPVFATLTPDGWVLPDWLVALKYMVVMRDFNLSDEL